MQDKEMEREKNVTTCDTMKSSSTSKGFKREKSMSKEEIHHNLSALTKEMQSHVKSTQKAQFNDTVNEILTSVMDEEKKKMKTEKNRNSILTLDILKDSREIKSYSIAKIKKVNLNSSNGSKLKKSVGKIKTTDISSSFDSNSSKDRFKNSNFYQRELEHEQKKKFKIEKHRNKLRIEERKKCSNIPMLSKNSMKIMNEIKDKPLYLRVQDVMEKKINKIENLKRVNREIKRQELDKSNIINNLQNPQPFDKDKIESFINEQSEWQKKKERKLEILKKQLELQKEIESPTYRPEINPTSEILVRMKAQADMEGNSKAAYERLFQEHENKMLRNHKLFTEQLPVFTPVINKSKLNYLNRPNFITSEKLSNLRVNSVRCKANINNSRSSDKLHVASNNQEKQNPKLAITGKNKNEKLNISAMELDSSANLITLTPSSKIKAKTPINNKNFDKMFANACKEGNSTIDVKNNLYKLNIRSASAWDNNGQENNIYMNPKYSSLLRKIIKC